MPRQPVFKPKELERLCRKHGFVTLRQAGSHLHLYHQEKKIRITIPMHNKDLKRKTLANILRQAQIKL